MGVQGVSSHTRRELLYDLLLGTALVSAGGAVTAGPAEAALVQMPTQRLKNRYYLVRAHLQRGVFVCLLAVRSRASSRVSLISSSLILLPDDQPKISGIAVIAWKSLLSCVLNRFNRSPMLQSHEYCMPTLAQQYPSQLPVSPSLKRAKSGSRCMTAVPGARLTVAPCWLHALQQASI